MSGDLDIEIRVDATGKAVADLSKVSAQVKITDKDFESLAKEMQRVEEQAKETRQGLATMGVAAVSLGDASVGLAKKFATAKEELGKMLKEAAKGQAMNKLQEAARGLGGALEEASGGAFNMGDAMLGLQVAGPVGAVVGGFAGVVKEAGFNIDFAKDALKELTKGVKDYRLTLADWIDRQNNANDAMVAAAKVVRKAREELQQYNAEKAKAFAGGLLQQGNSPWAVADRATRGGARMGGETGYFEPRAGGDEGGVEQSWESALGSRGRFGMPGAGPGFSITDPLAYNAGATAGMNPDELTFEEIGSQVSAADDALKQWHADLEKSQESAAELVARLQPLEDFFVNAARTGKFEWKSLIDSMIADLTRLATHQLFMSLAGMLLSPGAAPTGAMGLAGLGGGLGGAVSGGNHAFGGSFIAPMTGGGQDTIPVLSMVSPGERIDYTPPGHAPGGGATTSPNVNLRVVNQADHDPRALAQALDGPHGDRLFMNFLRRNRGAIKPLVND